MTARRQGTQNHFRTARAFFAPELLEEVSLGTPDVDGMNAEREEKTRTAS
jgi:hypothetical protein